MSQFTESQNCSLRYGTIKNEIFLFLLQKSSYLCSVNLRYVSRLMLQKLIDGNLNLNNYEESDQPHKRRGTGPSE